MKYCQYNFGSNESRPTQNTVPIRFVAAGRFKAVFRRNQLVFPCLTLHPHKPFRSIYTSTHSSSKTILPFNLRPRYPMNFPNRTFTYISHFFLCPVYRYTGYTQKNGAVSKVNNKFISHLTRAQRTPTAA